MAERRIPSSRPATQPVSLKARHCRLALAVATCFTAGVLTAHAAGGSLPTGATYDPTKVASITTSGNVMTIKTLANRTVFGWDNHDIGAGYGVNYIQPTASSWVLSKVNSPDPTTIYGSLTSNGGVWLINKSGILVGNGARIDVAGFIGSTLNVSDANFLAGKLKFDATPGAGGVTVEQGAKITTPSGGSVYLVAPNVSNAGIITTPKGETILAAGETVELIDTGTPGVKVEITGAVGNATNLGEIYAEAGRIGIAGVLVKNSGTLNASSVVNEGGRVFLKASQDAYVDGNGRIVTTGTKGGQVEVLGNRVAIAGNASIDASGDFGGGEVLIGGDYQGKNPDVQNAKATYFGPNASLKADARVKGNGGKVIVWADDATRAYGTISARGGAQGGNGGFIETSGGWLDTVGIKVSAAAPHGKSGTWLLDPYDIEVVASGNYIDNDDSGLPGEIVYFGGPDGGGASKIAASTIVGQLNSGTSVILDTHRDNGNSLTGPDNGDITVNAAINKTLGGDATLWLKADRSIIINEAITSTSGALGVILQAHANDTSVGAAGNVQIYANISTNGGNVLIGGGDLSATPSGYANGYNDADYWTRYGVLVQGATINAGGGNITIRGAGINNPIAGDTDGFELNDGSLITNGTGAISLYGQAGNGATSGTSGVYIWGTIQTVAGDIIIEGRGGDNSSAANRGVKLDGQYGPTSITSDSGNISITGWGGNTSPYGGPTGNIGVLFNLTGNQVISNSGSISIAGYGGGLASSDNGGVWIGVGNVVNAGGSFTDIYGSGGYDSSFSDGVHIEGSNIYNTGAGYVRIYGDGASNNASGVSNSRGVYLTNANIMAGDGGIQITGNSWGDSSGSYNDGVLISGASNIYIPSGSGSIQITGHGRGGDHSPGVAIADTTAINTQDGDITITGSSSSYTGSGGGNFGVVMFGAGPSVASYGGGTILISGDTDSTDDPGLALNAGYIYANSGDIKLRADSASMDSINIAGVSLDGFGRLILEPYSSSDSIGIGNGASGHFNIDNADHAAVSASNNFTQLVIGKVFGSHAIEINRDANPTNVVFNASSVSLTSGHTMTLSNGGSVAVYGGYFYNDGTVDLNHGTFYTDNGFSNNSGGLLKGSGTIDGNLDNYGTVWVNGGGTGALSITGNFTQYGGGTLKVDVAGNGQSDQLQVGGTANLDGTLYLNAGYGGYLTSAPPGDAITVLSAGTISGDFVSISNQGVFTDIAKVGTYALSVPGGGGCGDGFEACWIGGDGLWSNAGNWLNGYIPVNSTDDVRLDGNGHTITLNGQSVTIGRFYSAHDHFVFNGSGSYSFTAGYGGVPISFGSGTTFTVNDGTANFNGQTTLHQFNLIGGTANFNYTSAENVIARLALSSGAYGGGMLGGAGFVRVTESFSQQAYGGYINRSGGLDITQVSGDLAYYGGTTGDLALRAIDGSIVVTQDSTNVNGTFVARASGDLNISNTVVYATNVDINVSGGVFINGDWSNAGLRAQASTTITSNGMQLNAYGGDAYIRTEYGGTYINTGSGDLELQAYPYSFRSAYIEGSYDPYSEPSRRGDIEIHTHNLVLDGAEGNAHIYANRGDVTVYANDVTLTTSEPGYGAGQAYIRSNGGSIDINASGVVTLDARLGGDAYLYAYGGNVLVGANAVSLYAGYGSANIVAELDWSNYAGGYVVVAATGDVTVDGRQGSGYTSASIMAYGGWVETGPGTGVYAPKGGVHVGAGGAVNVFADGGEGFIAAYDSNLSIDAANLSLSGNNWRAQVFTSWDGGDVSIKTTGGVSLDRSDIHAEYGLVSIIAGDRVALDNGSAITTWSDWEGRNSSVLIAAGTDVTLKNGSYIEAWNYNAPPNVEILVDQGSIKLESGSHISAGNDVLLTLNGARSTLEIGLNDQVGEIQVLSEGPGFGPYSYILSDAQTMVPRTTVITFTKVSKDGILINGAPTDLMTAGAAPGAGAGLFVATETGYQSAYIGHGIEVTWGTPDNPVLRAASNSITDFFEKLSSATDVEGDAAAKKKKLESDKQGSEQNGQENKSSNHCS